MKLTFFKIKISTKAVLRVITRPAYLLIAIFGSLLASSLLLWLFNLDLIMYILFSAPISVVEKLDFFFSVFWGIFTTYNSIQAVGIVVFSVLFGINLALLVFALRHRTANSLPKKSGASGLILAVVGGGCLACGTSLLAPLLATAGASSTVALQDLAGLLQWTASIFITYSIYKLGSVCAYIFASK